MDKDLADMLAAFRDDLAVLRAGQETMQAELSEVHGLVRQTARVTTDTRNRLDVMIDAYATHRLREILAGHPHDQ